MLVLQPGQTAPDSGVADDEAYYRAFEASLADPGNRGTEAGGQPVRSHGYAWLYQESEPLTADVRLAGSAVLDAYVQTTTPGQHLTPVLAEVTPDGALHLVERGFLNLDLRNGLAKPDASTGWLHGRVTLLPQDYTFRKGSRIGLLLQGSNTVWGVPGAAGALSYAMGPLEGVTTVGTRLLLPVVGSPKGLLAR